MNPSPEASHPGAAPPPAASILDAPRGARRFVVLVEGSLGVLDAKTAVALLRYAPASVAALLDSTRAGQTAEQALGFGGAVPIVGTLLEALAFRPDALLVGIAPVGGLLPAPWRALLRDALAQGLDLWAGLHTFLADDPELAALAAARGRSLVDLRRVPAVLPVASARAREVGARIVLTVGSDCNSGKMTVAWEVVRGLTGRGESAVFVATGQTGVLLAGRGLAVDRVVSDFVAGAAEALVLDAAPGHDWVVVEGQGALIHPGYSGVTLGLLHGALPEAMILCHQPTRTEIRHGGIAIPPLPELVRRYEDALAPLRRGRVVAVALNTYDLDAPAARRAIADAHAATGLVATDPVRFGAAPLVDALLAFARDAAPSTKGDARP
jgi:uncharacterized NAD-dependent epimerase/dehydratase family protein